MALARSTATRPSDRVGRGGEYEEVDRRLHLDEFERELAFAESLSLRLVWI